jgi:hypothetical protein
MSKSKINPLINNPLFDVAPEEEHWRGMPKFKQDDNGPYRQVIVSLEDEKAEKDFFKLIDQTYTDKTKSIWFPERPISHVTDLFWFSEDQDSDE